MGRAKNQILSGYCERHHILPKCLGGSNDPANLVRLTAREHFICHLLLTRMVADTKLRSKLVFAAWQQSRSCKAHHHINNRIYDALRRALSETYTSRKRQPFTEECRQNMSKAHMGVGVGVKHAPSSIAKMSANRKGKACGIANPFYGKTHSPSVHLVLAEKNRRVFTGVPKYRCSCIYCHKEITVNILPRYHGVNCKLKS